MRASVLGPGLGTLEVGKEFVILMDTLTLSCHALDYMNEPRELKNTMLYITTRAMEER